MAFIFNQKSALDELTRRFGINDSQRVAISNVLKKTVAAQPIKTPTILSSSQPIITPPSMPNTPTVFNPTPIIPPISSNPPVVSSLDASVRFEQNRDELDRREVQPTAETKPEEDVVKKEEYLPTQTTPTPQKTSGDKLVDAYEAEIQQTKTAGETKLASEKAEYETLFQTRLANINSTTAGIISNIQSLFSKRIAQQQRINQLNIDRAKAYGLATGAQFTPIEFGDAITAREREADIAIGELEGERDRLIAEAQNARNEGEAGLLQDKMTDLRKIENDINNKLNETYKTSLAQYKLQLEALQEQEKVQKEAAEVQKKETQRQLAGMAIEWADEYEQAKDKEKFIKNLEANGWGSATDIFLALRGALKTKRDEEYKKKKGEIDIRAQESLIAQRKASAYKTYADAAETAEEKKLAKQMKAEIDAMDSPSSAKRVAFVKKYGTEGRKYWDDVFFNEEENMYDYETTSGEGDSDSLRARVNNAGYDYDAMKKDGISDEEIKKELGL